MTSTTTTVVPGRSSASSTMVMSLGALISWPMIFLSRRVRELMRLLIATDVLQPGGVDEDEEPWRLPVGTASSVDRVQSFEVVASA
jgi:hypothetical protein